MKIIKLFLILFAIIIGFSIPLLVRYYHLKQPRLFPDLTYSVPDAPGNAIKGQIIDSDGSAFLQPRYATVSQPLTLSYSLIQGEGIQTSFASTIELLFPGQVSLHMGPESSFDYTNGMVPNLLIAQNSGEITYTPIANQTSVRVLHLLVNPTASSSITIASGLVTIRGTGQIAYEDKAFVTHFVQLPSNRRLLFDDLSRTYKFIR